MGKTLKNNWDPSGETARPGPFVQVQAHIPLGHLKKKINLFLDHPINPEIYFNYSALRRMPEEQVVELASTLREHGKKVTIHGPFCDLSPGAVDSGFRALTLDRMRLALKRAKPFSPRSVVLHPGYDPLKFGEYRDTWLKNSLRTWKQLLPLAEKMPGLWILIENIFESDPFTLAELLAGLPSPPFGFCFDTGHFQVFSELPLEKWLEVLGPYLREVHLHDNHGEQDEHLPPGRGIFDFLSLFKQLAALPHPIIGTLEAHREPDLFEGLTYLKALGIYP